MNNHNYSNTSKQIAQSSGTATTTDAVIIQSNSNVVTDEFLQQLQEQFGGENKQIYILNTNNSGTSLTSVNTDSSSASLSSNNTNSQIQYLIVDKDVDINLILQDPSIFNNQQQQQQPIEPPIKQTQPKFSTNNRFSNNQAATTTPTTTTTTNTTNGLNQMLAVEESIQRVQVPPPKRKQFELKLENKKNSYQDVFLRYLAGEKQPTLEIMQSEYAHSANKKPKDNLNYQTNSKIASNSAVTTPIGSSKIAIPTSNSTSPAVANQIIANQSQTVNLDKENYYNSSRRENLLPLNNYEYRNSYKDHYDNQGVRVNPAVLKNLSYSGASSGTTPVNSSSSNSSIINRAVNLPTKKLNDIIAFVPVVNSNQAKSPINVPKSNQEVFNYSNGKHIY